MSPTIKAYHAEARRMTAEMHKLEDQGDAGADRLAVVYARLVELEQLIWG